eukprot:gnl/MRDRNA2_/MRDRNA2_143485_c0_seq1.p1 gnl/MRDRNA2_/MRDRNA2_143485_c0~~gnl/MRDRNA2_/MRDRNA2_143485_c0_seq1.p1  ORF type:complete len:302 (+),score=52.81 gnl/MRDRNA2_/MRDRNA2_143485_c0_seq1:84-989(+)
MVTTGQYSSLFFGLGFLACGILLDGFFFNGKVCASRQEGYTLPRGKINLNLDRPGCMKPLDVHSTSSASLELGQGSQMQEDEDERLRDRVADDELKATVRTYSSQFEVKKTHNHVHDGLMDVESFAQTDDTTKAQDVESFAQADGTKKAQDSASLRTSTDYQKHEINAISDVAFSSSSGCGYGAGSEANEDGAGTPDNDGSDPCEAAYNVILTKMAEKEKACRATCDTSFNQNSDPHGWSDCMDSAKCVQLSPCQIPLHKANQTSGATQKEWLQRAKAKCNLGQDSGASEAEWNDAIDKCR